MRLRQLWIVPLLFLAACGSDHPLAGNWSQELPGDAHGMSLEFQVDGDRVMVHTAPRPDGGHGHERGTYTWDAAAKSITVQAPLAGDGKATTWTGTVDGEHMELGSADGKLQFHRGGEAPGH
jgi:hypothetical protein